MLFSSSNPFSLNNVEGNGNSAPGGEARLGINWGSRFLPRRLWRRERGINLEPQKFDGQSYICFLLARRTSNFPRQSLLGGPAQNLNDFVSRIPKPTETCPGVCVAERLSGFCEAILNVDDLCKSNLRCCVSKETYDDDAPGALFIPNGSKPPPPVKRKTTKKPKVNRRKPPKRKGGDDCKGTCVTGFFALLCEDIDKSVECPGWQMPLCFYLIYLDVLLIQKCQKKR